ncbi:MAG: TIGR03915 family putative DNA repair protein [Lachnospiraceae bacterium]
MDIFVCGEEYEEIMATIYDAWVLATKVGHANVKIERASCLDVTFLNEYHYAPQKNKGNYSEEVEQKAEKVTRAVKEKISKLAYVWIYRAAMSVLPDAPDAIYRFMILGFSVGPKVTDMLTRPEVMRMMELNRKVGNEMHSFVEFVRFRKLPNGVYYSVIQPKSNVVELVAGHFEDRMPSENFIIIDENRRLAAVHPKNDSFYLQTLQEDEVEYLRDTEKKDAYSDMWQTFFETVAIEQRANERCQRNHFPVWMRKYATEFI